MAMVTELLPHLRLAAAPRVISVLSGGVHASFNGFESDPELKHGAYSIANAANAAGFYNDLGLDWLAAQPANEKVAFVHAAPGFVNTNWCERGQTLAP
jgi:NAD(P)-dependent dehydrogenase (short-subunit alcohol dehydrogenase family)